MGHGELGGQQGGVLWMMGSQPLTPFYHDPPRQPAGNPAKPVGALVSPWDGAFSWDLNLVFSSSFVLFGFFCFCFASLFVF